MIVLFRLFTLVLFFTPDGKNIVGNIQLNVFLLKAGQLRRDLNLLVGFAEIHARHQLAPWKARKASRESLEQAVDLLLERRERIGCGTRYATVASHRNQGFE